MKKFTFILTLLILTPISLLAQGWQSTFGGSNDDVARDVLQTNDGGFVLVGYTQSFGAGNADVFLVKTDAQGNEQWSQTYKGISDAQLADCKPAMVDIFL